MLHVFRGTGPKLSESAYVSESSFLVGNVSVGERSSVWFGAVLRGDAGPIKIGCDTNVQDNAVIHAEPGGSVEVGDRVTIGHGAVVHGSVIGDEVLIGMNATVLSGAVVGEGSIVGAGALVTEGKTVPPRSLVLGVPGKIVRELSDEDVAKIRKSAEEYVSLAFEYLKGK